MTTNDGTVGRYLGWFLVALSLGSGVIHFAVAGEHFDLSWYHGTFFAAVAWLQLMWAAAVIVRPTRPLLAVAAVGNALIIVTWLVSRVWGVPVGPDAWESEPVALADALATGFEAVIVVLALAVLFRPALAQQTLRPRLGFAALGASGLAIAVVSTMALSPSFASDHHGDDGEESAAHGHEEATAHEDMTPEEMAAHGGEATAHDDAAAHDDAEGHTNYVITADGSSACEESGVANEGNSGHGHRGPVPFEAMDEGTRSEFAAQVHQANDAVARFPTVADAEAAGYRGITPYVPCIAAHYIKNEALMNPFDPAEPEILLFDGTDPGSQIVGLSYLQFTGTGEGPVGFAGDNDPWHAHRQLCLGSGDVLGDESTTEEDCAARGGNLIQLDDLFMTHMWNVPGWESRWGLFSSEHPDLGGTVGDINA
ncbi:MAG: hypothetical protein ACRD2C_10305 [Acidimicrobiales bacterium]